MIPLEHDVVIDRVMLVTTDLDRAEADYSSVLACELLGRDVLDPEVGAILGTAGRRGRRSALRLGRERIDVVQFDGAAGRAYPADSTSTDLWFQHLAIVVSDMDLAHRRIARSGRFRPISRGGPVLLPPGSGGVTAYKFRDSDGHPLELLAFPARRTPESWKRRTASTPFLGIDHTAISVADTVPNSAFLRNAFGWDVRGNSENRGREQEHLDDLDDAVVTVTGFGPAVGAPGIELLDYHVGTRRGISSRSAGHDVATTYSVLKVKSLDRLRRDAEANGARYTSDVVTRRDGGRSMLVVGPDGHRFLAEEPPHGDPGTGLLNE